MSRLVEIWTDDAGESRFTERELEIDRHAVRTIHSAVTPAGGSLGWHDAPCDQYVVTLTGTLRFTTRRGEQFVLSPGDVLLARDTTGGGHEWELIDDQPWTRLYVEIGEAGSGS
ncbi:hypothetical protein [Gordonia soli]|uniref:Cupin 2 conserved barrel domain-containing protein n=1 Tax=Gordonia soli NBRC 108243 TaxID=1223545 RepID=M0QCX5_9ACTN|nr:hypothetical protein [Gordonia soli]GAC66458.1 hypothetical protein GS4_02_01690 [Gordonia soli NBRC 108243]